MERIRYTLKHPIEYETTGEGGAKTKHRITELMLAPRIKGRHMKATDTARGPVDAKLALISSLAALTRMEADELDEHDLMRIDALYGDHGEDLIVIARRLGLAAPQDAEINDVLSRIDALLALEAREGADPLVPGAGLSTDGQATGGTSPAT